MTKWSLLAAVGLFVVTGCSSSSTTAESPASISGVPSASTPLNSTSSSPASSASENSSPEQSVTEAAQPDVVEETIDVVGRPADNIESIQAALVDAMNGELSSTTYQKLSDDLAQYGVTTTTTVRDTFNNLDSSNLAVVSVQKTPGLEMTQDGSVYQFAGNTKIAQSVIYTNESRADAVSRVNSVIVSKLQADEPEGHRYVWIMTVSDDGSTAELDIRTSTLDSNQ